MIVCWTGWGILAILIWAASLSFTQFTVDRLHHQGYFTANAWPKFLATLLGGPVLWVLGRAMNGSPKSVERQAHGARHTLFGVPMEYWGPIFLGVGVSLVLVEFLTRG